MAEYEIYRETDKIGLYVTRSELEVILNGLASLGIFADARGVGRLSDELEEAALEWDGK